MPAYPLGVGTLQATSIHHLQARGAIAATVANAPYTMWGLYIMPGERDPGEAGEGLLKARGAGPPGTGPVMAHPAAALFLGLWGPLHHGEAGAGRWNQAKA